VLPAGADADAPVKVPVREAALHSFHGGENNFVAGRSLASIRGDFPILAEEVGGGPLVWLDNAATTQKPQAVIDRIAWFYRHENSNVHRGAHELASRATAVYEEARRKAAAFIGASPENIVFTRGATEGINLAAQAFVKPLLREGDEIVLSALEHHANIVPWQLIAEETGAVLVTAPVDDSGQIVMGEYARLFNRRTKFAAFAHVSNALGAVLPVGEMAHIAHASGVPVLVDGAQSAPHLPVNVSALDADFFVFSGHKVFGPTGIGVLYGRTEALQSARPYHGGGGMIADVTFARTLYNPPPQKFEAGTPNIAGAAGLGAAIDYVDALGMDALAAWEGELLRYGLQELAKIPGLRLLGSPSQRVSVLAFNIDGMDSENAAARLADRGIAVRAGHHCAQPIHRRFGLEGSVRASLAFYNTPGEIDALVRALREMV
jgi:cysteine desulfurase/selenocysteine lyase